MTYIWTQITWHWPLPISYANCIVFKSYTSVCIVFLLLICVTYIEAFVAASVATEFLVVLVSLSWGEFCDCLYIRGLKKLHTCLPRRETFLIHWCWASSVVGSSSMVLGAGVRNVGLIWSLFLKELLYLSGIWRALYLRTANQIRRTLWSLVTYLILQTKSLQF
jgi:hypothetical protein